MWFVIFCSMVAAFGQTVPTSRAIVSAKTIPDFILPDVNGKPLRLSTLRGRIVVIEFWAMFCGPCRAELPVIEKIHREYRNSNLTILAINADNESPAKVRSFLRKNNYTFPVLLDPTEDAYRKCGSRGKHVVLVLDGEGRIAKQFAELPGRSKLISALKQVGVKKDEPVDNRLPPPAKPEPKPGPSISPKS